MTLANFIASFGMPIFFGVIVFLDWLSRRKERPSRHYHPE
jgi:hypothetical protein